MESNDQIDDKNRKLYVRYAFSKKRNSRASRDCAQPEIVDARLSRVRRDKGSYVQVEVDARSPPGAIESHPVAAAFWLTASWLRENTLPTWSRPRVRRYTHTRASESAVPAYHTCNDPVNLNLRRSRLVSSRGTARIVRRNVVKRREGKKGSRPGPRTREREREGGGGERIRAVYPRKVHAGRSAFPFAEGDKLGTHDDVNRYQETAGAPGAQRGSQHHRAAGDQHMRRFLALARVRMRRRRERSRGRDPRFARLFSLSLSQLLNSSRTKMRAG